MDDASLKIKLEEETFMVIEIESNIECEVYDSHNIVPINNKKSVDSNEEQFPANSKFQPLVIRMGTSICNFDGIFDKAVGKTFKMSFDPVDGQMVLTETEIPKFKPVITMGYSSNVPVAVATQESCSKAKEVYYENIGNQLTDSHSKCKSGVPSNLSQAPSIVCLSDDKIDETPIKNSLLGQLRSFNSKEKISETTPTKKRRIEKESSFQTELLQEANSIHISDEPMEQLENQVDPIDEVPVVNDSNTPKVGRVSVSSETSTSSNSAPKRQAQPQICTSFLPESSPMFHSNF